ncbi:hypothetical protein EJ07DRAFT_186578 [Lizonia empirigonia]|nr:hypothetical protein EJ07DRAFT_186578 [Lizonia empirigonia]
MAMVEVDKAALTNRAFRLGLGWFNIEKAIQADVTAAITNALLFSRKDDIGVKNCPHPVIKLFLSIAPNQNNMSAQVPLQGFYRLLGGMVEGLLIHRPHVEKHEPVLAAQLTFTDRTTSTLGHRSIPTARLTSARSLGKRAAETPAISATEGVPDVGSDDDTPMGGFEPADNFFADEKPGASGVIPSADDAQAHAGATLGFETEGDSGAAAGVGGASSGAGDDLVQLPGYPCTIQGHALIGHV